MIDFMNFFDKYRKDIIIDGTPYIDELLNYLNSIGESELLKEHIPTLTIKIPDLTEEEKRRKRYADGSYNASTNTITIYNTETIYHELAHVASYKDQTTRGVIVPSIKTDEEIEEMIRQGKDDNDFIVGKSFNEGFCDYLASKIDPNYQLRYPLEKLIVDKLIDKFGNEPLIYFLKADYQSFHKFINTNNLNSLLSNLDNITNLYEKAKSNQEDAETFYNSYYSIMNDNLKELCSEEEIKELEDNFFSTSIGVETNKFLYDQEVKKINKKEDTI
ncbi:MAG: hypothetical protein IJL76_01585 [Bacilli bacterium]|nr:hypothetical protein [Bacilli bacterium]